MILGLMPDPTKRIEDLKKADRQANQAQKLSKEDTEISYKWMTMFEQMHQERMKKSEEIHALEVQSVQKDSKITLLEAELNKANNIINEMKTLLQSQRKFIDECEGKKVVGKYKHSTLYVRAHSLRRRKYFIWIPSHTLSHYHTLFYTNSRWSWQH